MQIPFIRCLFIALVSPFGSVCAEDWNRFRGPMLDGISREAFSPSDWMNIKIAWKQNVQTGLSGVVVSDQRVYTMGNEDDRDTVFCLDASTGKIVWKHTYESPTDPNEFEGGPTSTPTVDDDLLFTLSRGGDVHCFDKSNGQVKWQQNIPDETNIRVPGWGFAGSPLVIDDRLFLNVGDAGVAIQKQTGKIEWRSADKDSGYSSIVPIQFGDRQAVVFGSARSYVCVAIDDGKELWRQRWLTTFGCNAADPIVVEDKILVSSGYNRGTALLEVTEDGPEIVWKHKDLQNQISTSILIDGCVYGIHGDIDAGTDLRCIDFDSGDVKWTATEFHPTAIAAVGSYLLIVTDEGELLIGAAEQSGFETLATIKVLDHKCWTSPVYSGNRIYCRSATGDLVCLVADP